MVPRDTSKLEGYRVEKAADGHAALLMLRATRPDAIVLDLMMPGMDGWTLPQPVPQRRPVQLHAGHGDVCVSEAWRGHSTCRCKPVWRNPSISTSFSKPSSACCRRHPDSRTPYHLRGSPYAGSVFAEANSRPKDAELCQLQPQHRAHHVLGFAPDGRWLGDRGGFTQRLPSGYARTTGSRPSKRAALVNRSFSSSVRPSRKSNMP